MKTKLFALIAVAAFAAPAFADDAADAEVAAEIVVEEVSEQPPAPVIVSRDNDQRKQGTGRGAGSITDARVGMVGAVNAAEARTAATAAVAATAKSAECPDKTNPFVEWEDVDACKIKECASDEYMLVGQDTDSPRCLKKCEIWGGAATKVWEGNNFGVCGSGDFIECGERFNKRRDRTSASEMEFWHCVPVGARFGSCDRAGQSNICEFPNGKAQQLCENGYWGTCSLRRMCDEGFRESKPREVITVSRKKDMKTSVFDCVEK